LDASDLPPYATQFEHTILSGNILGSGSANDCYDETPLAPIFTGDSAYNVFGALGNCDFYIPEPPAPLNLLNTNALLLPLTNNGGLNQTQAIPANSPARDSGVAGAFPCQVNYAPLMASDQRGVPYENACDIGNTFANYAAKS
jgi:hypothetical protein